MVLQLIWPVAVTFPVPEMLKISVDDVELSPLKNLKASVLAKTLNRNVPGDIPKP